MTRNKILRRDGLLRWALRNENQWIVEQFLGRTSCKWRFRHFIQKYDLNATEQSLVRLFVRD